MKNLTITAFLTALLIGCAATEMAQQTPEERRDQLLTYSESITPELLRSHLEVIAHDSLEGRETGTIGEIKAMNYIIDFYEQLNITPKGTDGYRQPYILNAERVDSLVYRTFSIANGDTVLLNHSKESTESSAEYLRLFGGAEPQRGDIIFGGFGVNDPQRGVQHVDAETMAGNWVLIFDDIPHIVEGDTLINPGISNNNRVGNLLGSVNADGVIVVTDMSEDEYKGLSEMNSELLGKPSSMRLQYLDDSQSGGGFPKAYTMASPQMAIQLLGLDSIEELSALREETISNITTFRPSKTPFYLEFEPYDGTVEIESNNILAFIEGNDPELKEEAVVLMAHYDHIGITQPDATGDQINNGADDNGSGTVTLMAIAKSLQEAKDSGHGLDRSVLFLHVSAEEKGLLGSRYYSDHPVISIENTVANFNADMIGRSDPENIERGDTDYVYLIGGEIISSELDSLVQAANSETVDMRLDRRYNDLTDSNQFYRRSDHWNFGRLDVPFVFFFTGVHADYHRPGDEVHKIDFEKLSRIGKLIYGSTVQVANYDGRPVVDNQEFIDITRRTPR